LKRIGNEVARKEMLRIYEDNTVALRWRVELAEYLRIAPPQNPNTSETRVSAGSATTMLQSP